MYGLIDCNNFYVSCERVFRPRLIGKPVIVLSNNDGCVISRSAEAKALGVPMGIPVYQIKELIERENIEVCSSNYELYGDLSNRVMSVIRSDVPEQEVYSIDECFVYFTPRDNLDIIARSIRQKVLKGVGIPTCVGVAPTKTLAKLANHIAKRNPELQGVRVIHQSSDLTRALQETSIGDIWGIGRRSTKKLKRFGIHTAFDFTQRSPRWVRKNLTIVGLDTYYELMGYPRITHEAATPTQSMLRSRSFGHPLESERELLAVLMQFADIICTQLHDQLLVAGKIEIFLSTSPFDTNIAPYMAVAEFPLSAPTAHLPVLAPLIQQLLGQIYRPNAKYKRAGVRVTDLTYEFARLPFFDPQKDQLERIFSTQQKILHKHGKYSIHLASIDPTILSKAITREHTCPSFTTRWDQLLEITPKE